MLYQGAACSKYKDASRELEANINPMWASAPLPAYDWPSISVTNQRITKRETIVSPSDSN